MLRVRALAGPPRRRVAESLAISREQARLRWEAVRLAYRSARAASTALLLVSWVAAGLVVTFVYFSGLLIGAVAAAAHAGWRSSSGHQVVEYLVLAGTCFLLTQVLSPVRARLSDLLTRKVDGAVREHLASASAQAPGIAAFEDQRLLWELSLVKEGLDEGRSSPGEAVAGLATLSGAYLQAFLAAALIAVLLSPLVALGPLAGGLLIRRTHRSGLAIEAKARIRDWDLAREAGYYRQVALNPAAGREIRVFGLASWLRQRYRQSSVRSLETSMATRRKVHGVRFALPVLAATVLGIGSLLWVADQAGTASVPLRNLVVCLQAAYLCLQVGNSFPEDHKTQWGLQAQRALEMFETGTAELASSALSQWRGCQDTRGLPRESLSFDAVSFCYPGSDRLVLDNLSLNLPAGQSLAVVGLNGAGKSTLVKLLAGLYEPSGGAIRVDGAELREMRLAHWQRNVAAVYQDFQRYEITAAENIAFGDAARADKRGDIRWAAARAGILPVLESLPRGLDTPLAAGYRDGTDLSGGQWQRVALARAYYQMRQGAGVLILDEPTASLDIRSEAAFLSQFFELTKGVTTIVISHRFATVRQADRIAVLAGGRITELGTHDDLLSSGGRYAELFKIQGERFTADVGGARSAAREDQRQRATAEDGE